MKTTKLFIWFMVKTWINYRGDRKRYFRQFIPVWRVFYKLARKESL
jgi:hypothetical protein